MENNPFSSIPVLFEDNHILILNKPAGLLSQSDGGGDDDILSLSREMIRIRDRKPGNVYLGLVHRLDRNVGGVFCLAKTSKAAARLSEQIRKGEIKKTYLVVVEGRMREAEGLLVHYTVKDETNRMALPASPQDRDAKEARLRYKRMEQPEESEKPDVDFLEVELLTGRFHQIRFQFSREGHPVVGDSRYGSDIRLGERRIALRSIRMEFIHPVKKEPVSFEALPEEGWPWKDSDFVK